MHVKLPVVLWKDVKIFGTPKVRTVIQLTSGVPRAQTLLLFLPGLKKK